MREVYDTSPVGWQFGEYTVPPEQERAIRLPSGLEVAAGLIHGLDGPNLIVIAGIDHNWHNPAHPVFKDVDLVFNAFSRCTEGMPRKAFHEGRECDLPPGVTKAEAFAFEGRAEVGSLVWSAKEKGIPVTSAEPPLPLALASLLSPRCHNISLDNVMLMMWMRQQPQARIAGMPYDDYIQKTVIDRMRDALQTIDPADVANLPPDALSLASGIGQLPFRLLSNVSSRPSSTLHDWGFTYTPKSLIALYEQAYGRKFDLKDDDIAMFTSQTTGHMFGVSDAHPNGIVKQVSIALNDDRDTWHFADLHTASTYCSIVDLTGKPHMRLLTPPFNTSAAVARTMLDPASGAHSFQLGGETSYAPPSPFPSDF